MALFPFAAAMVSGWFSLSLLRRFLKTKSPQQMAWSVALAAFALASVSAAAGMWLGWSPVWFRSYYLFGAVVNVPILALGTLYLYLPRWAGHLASVGVGVLCVLAVAVVLNADLASGLREVAGTIPAGSEVLEEGPRALSRYYSYSGFLVVVGGAVWSAAKLARRSGLKARRLMQGNLLIAAGTSVVAAASAFARQGQGSVFAVGLALGASIMYVGFARASGQPRRAASDEASASLGGGGPQ